MPQIKKNNLINKKKQRAKVPTGIYCQNYLYSQFREKKVIFVKIRKSRKPSDTFRDWFR